MNQSADTYPVDFPLSFFKSKALEKAIEGITPALWRKESSELEWLAKPTETEKKLRRRYWELISNSIGLNDSLTIGDLHNGICSYTHLYNNIFSDPLADFV